MSDRTAKATLSLADRLRHDLPLTAAALLGGTTTLEHVKALVAGTAGLDVDLVRDCEASLLTLLHTTDPTTVRTVLRDRALDLDPRLADHAARRQHDRRGITADPLPDGTVLLGGTLTGEPGARFLLALDLATEADRIAGDTRSQRARRADALVAFADTWLRTHQGPGSSLAQDTHTVRTHLLITCTPEQLTDLTACEQQHADRLTVLAILRGHPHATGVPPTLASTPAGLRLPHPALRRLACDATVSLLVRDPARTDPLHVGRSARTVTAAQFKALVTRDRHCVAAGCHRRPAQCAAHHVQHWLDGGPTDLHNLVLLCHAHHHDHHDHHDRGHTLQHHDGRWLTPTGWGTDPP